MHDDRKDPGEPDRSRISVDDANELRYWTRELGVDEETLRDLVQRKGGSTDRIRQEIRELRRRG